MAIILLKGGNLVDPSQNKILKRDILIEDGKVSRIAGKSIYIGMSIERGCQVVDCRGKLIVPGLIDMHVHWRTPGQEHKENLATGSMAALAGGFTSVVCMANTNPVIDDAKKLHQLLIRAENEALVNVYQVAAMSENLSGRHMTDLACLRDAGAIAFSDDGKGVQNPVILQLAMVMCSKVQNTLLLFHCQDSCFDTYDKRSEYFYIHYLLKFAESYSCPIHIQHVSCLESVQLIREAKVRGVKVTCETAPHYIALTQRDFKRIGVNAMMNPPLRGESDRRAIIKGLVDGTIDVIATDHAPHTDEEKNSDNPPFGIIGLETAVPVVLSVLQRHMSLREIFAKMTFNPSIILGLEQKGLIKECWPADITIIDLQKRKVLETKDLKSKSKNSPWLGKRMQGWPVMTIRKGEILMKDGKITI
ncbi:MAG: hypothetical protein A2Y67_03910 [Candidatus Buchananbacteria bacterium RBG_13_39_9]|uniref:Amidohydrolase-related domain-containing protein n=1 Tax=Candidatus Buchananbacteria bacterium RBG_13_39_9 TaxID=1797531 RepID=A0A1G1XNY5_9BACT|nr:MAG: hypothetical protein A2Y67_03910 [Candidatus Buchananbacteria bacterium RBG_13_39_9]